MFPLNKLAASGALCALCSAGHAGIPVIDVTAIAESIKQTLYMITQIEHMLTQIEVSRNTLQSMSGSRGLGTVQRNPALDNYVPLDAPAQLDSVPINGYAGLTAPARALRDADMVWNCQGFAGTTLMQCQSALAQPYQTKALLRQAIGTASGRIGQISGLLNLINSTQDQAAKLEIGARIQGEQALLQHEATRAQLLWMDAQNEQRRDEARRAERTAEMMTRPLDARAALEGGGL